MNGDPRLRTRLGRLVLPNPVICGSGEPVMTESGIRAALAAGVAGVIAKSVNEKTAAASQLDRADYAWLDRGAFVVDRPVAGGSLFCRSGLAQRASSEWFRAIGKIDRDAAKEGRFVAASIVLGGAEGAVELARQAREAGLRVFELNVGAPHAPEVPAGVIDMVTEPQDLSALVHEVRRAAGAMNLWVKLTGLATNLPVLAKAAIDGGADAVVMMGRFLAMAPDIDSFEPVLGSSAAYGGPWAVPIVCRYLALSRQLLGPDAPLLGTNGVRTGSDLLRMAMAGASAVEVLSLVMEGGFGALAALIQETSELLEKRNKDLQEVVGAAADRLHTYAERPIRPGRWRDFVPAETLREPI